MAWLSLLCAAAACQRAGAQQGRVDLKARPRVAVADYVVSNKFSGAAEVAVSAQNATVVVDDAAKHYARRGARPFDDDGMDDEAPSFCPRTLRERDETGGFPAPRRRTPPPRHRCAAGRTCPR